MGSAEKGLVLLLRLSGLLLLTALIPAVMPLAAMAAIHRWLGLGEMPEGPLIGYLTRSLSALYAAHGVLVLFVSLDVRRYLPLVKCLAALSVVFGIGMFVLDGAVGMPCWWIVGEGPAIVVLGIVLWWLAGSCGGSPGPVVARRVLWWFAGRTPRAAVTSPRETEPPGRGFVKSEDSVGLGRKSYCDPVPLGMLRAPAYSSGLRFGAV
ncbi:MAG: hypothetical protein A2V70_06395 [Planctomycetes bacterium RBG_13_63_9]|nr:MAG: hypothetical protein A2V70_06395 [Planctomycetes bacterium RBG_13_63_9]